MTERSWIPSKDVCAMITCPGLFDNTELVYVEDCTGKYVRIMRRALAENDKVWKICCPAPGFDEAFAAMCKDRHGSAVTYSSRGWVAMYETDCGWVKARDKNNPTAAMIKALYKNKEM